MKNILILGLVSFFTDMSSEMVYPLIPVFLMGTFGANPLIIGVIEGISHSFSSLFKIYFGHISDKIGKRKGFAAAGYTISALGKLIIGLSGNWSSILGGRTVDRLGKAARGAPRDALIAESTPAGRRGEAFGIHRALDTAGAFVGILIGYLILINFTGPIRSIFFYSLIPAAISVLIMLIFVREPMAPAPKTKDRTKLSWSVLPKNLKIFLLISLLFSLGNSSNLFLIIKAIDIGFFPVVIMLLYATYNLSYALFMYPASKLSDKIGRKTMLVSGYLIFGLVYLAFAFVNQPAWYWAMFFIYGAYVGLTEGVEKAYVVDNSPEQIRATVLGTHDTIVGVMMMPASILAGSLWQFFGPATPFYFSSLIGFLATILILLYIPAGKPTK